MPISRIAFTTLACAAVVALLAFAARAAQAPKEVPVVTITGHVTPGRLPIAPGTPLFLHLGFGFSSNPPGGDFVLQRTELLFGTESVMNGTLFPSCSARRLRAANGFLGVCPKASKVGSGSATGRAVALGISSTGRLTLFNGPGGRSLTMNLSVVRPAQINATWSAPIVNMNGGRSVKVTVPVPAQLQSILGGDIDVTHIDVTTGATRVVHGRRHGYFEARHCHGGTLHGRFLFKGGITTTAAVNGAC